MEDSDIWHVISTPQIPSLDFERRHKMVQLDLEPLQTQSMLINQFLVWMQQNSQETLRSESTTQVGLSCKEMFSAFHLLR